VNEKHYSVRKLLFERNIPKMPEDQSQASGDATSQTSSSAVQRGGAGAEKTPADPGTPQNISGSSVGLNGPLNFA
jgi:hypothetical protein